MSDILYVVLFLSGIVAVIFFSITHIPRKYKQVLEKLTLIEERRTRITPSLYAILEGKWRGIKLKIGIRVLLGHVRGTMHLFIILNSSCNPPCSLFIKSIPKSDKTFFTANLSKIKKFHLGEAKMRLPENKLEVLFSPNNEASVNRFLNPQRLEIISYLFDKGFNCIEINKTAQGEYCLKIDLEYSGFHPEVWKLRDKVMAEVLNSTSISNILQKLKEFSEVT